MNAKIFTKNFWRDERGQSTTEYILILAVVAMIAMKFSTKLKDITNKATEKLGASVDKAMTDE
jgi:Flp pilus assembly pilin Flp